MLLLSIYIDVGSHTWAVALYGESRSLKSVELGLHSERERENWPCVIAVVTGVCVCLSVSRSTRSTCLVKV